MTPPAMWRPKTEDELRDASINGLLDESHFLDLKRELESGASANKSVAKDIAAFALDGGVILIGLDEDTTPPSLHPIELAGLAERIEQIALTRVDSPVAVQSYEIVSIEQPGKGYLAIVVPASSRAPHMADGRYYGRGDKTNRVLPDAEVTRLHERALEMRSDLSAYTQAVLDDLGGGLLVGVAEPVGAHADLLVALSEDPSWERTTLELVQAASNREIQQQFSPSLANANGFGRRAEGVAITTGMYDGERFAGKDRAAELVFHESGRLVLASERAVTTLSFSQVNPRPPDRRVVLDALVVGQLDLLVRMAGIVGERYGFVGDWRFAVVVDRLRGTIASAHVDHGFLSARRPAYTEATYRGCTDAASSDIAERPAAVVEALVAPLLRSLDAMGRWTQYLAG